MEFWRRRRPPAGTIDREFDDRPVRDAPVGVAGPPDHRDAFAEGVRQGRREERARHHGHPLLSFLVVLVAVAGAAVLALAAREGSFARGGQVVDQHLSVAAGQAKATGADAVAKTGEAIRNAGQTIEEKASEPAARP